MIRTCLALVALLCAPVLIAAGPQDWTRTVVRTAEGAYAIGRPDAPVRLVEYLSYTCPHCAAFANESASTLKDKMVRSGKVRVELRHAVRDKLDLAAAIIARCAGPTGFSAASDAIFANQSEWYPRGVRFLSANDARLELYPEAARLRAYADGAGLTDLARKQGLNDAAIEACFADTADLGRVVTMSEAAWSKIKGTPGFELNGAPVVAFTWAALEPKLRAAGAR